jgi:hypothetical protein
MCYDNLSLAFGMGQLRWWALWVAYRAIGPACFHGVITHLVCPFIHRATIAICPFETWTALCAEAKYNHELVLT